MPKNESADIETVSNRMLKDDDLLYAKVHYTNKAGNEGWVQGVISHTTLPLFGSKTVVRVALVNSRPKIIELPVGGVGRIDYKTEPDDLQEIREGGDES